jgi:hypothetical protein
MTIRHNQDEHGSNSGTKENAADRDIKSAIEDSNIQSVSPKSPHPLLLWVGTSGARGRGLRQKHWGSFNDRMEVLTTGYTHDNM